MLRQRNFGFAGSSTAQLRELLNQKHMARVWMLRRDGSPETRYYFLTEPTANKQANYKAVAVVGFNGVTREVTVAQKNYRKPVLSPQSVVARDALAFLESKNQESWNKSLAEVFETLCRSPATDGIDPLIKLRLVHDFLLLSSKTSQGFRKQLDNLPAFKKLTANEAMSLAAGNWLDPREDDRLGQQRDKAAQLVEETPSLLPMLADADDFDRRQANIASQKESVSWIGWLAPGEHSPVAVVPFADRGNLRPGRIYVVANNKFIAIGSVVGDREALDDVAMEYLGYPVLAVAEVMDK
jgi:hypothetical protein